MTFYTPEEDADGLKGTGPGNDMLPYVLILGDSISIGYTEAVRERLDGICNVERADANCGDTNAGLANIQSWLGGRTWDVVHFNWGLHDLCCRHPDSKVYGNRDKIKGTVAVEVDQYAENLKQLVKIISQQAKHMIWASTTLVPEGEAGRHLGDDIKYNQAAAAVMEESQIPCNDLHAITSGFSADLFKAPGDVHYTKEGSRILAEAVVNSVKNALGTE